jgi:hypothetical protein
MLNSNCRIIAKFMYIIWCVMVQGARRDKLLDLYWVFCNDVWVLRIQAESCKKLKRSPEIHLKYIYMNDFSVTLPPAYFTRRTSGYCLETSYYCGAKVQIGPWPPRFFRFLYHTELNKLTISGRTPLNGWPIRRRGCYLHNTHKRRTFMPSTRFEPTIPGSSGRRPTP